MGARALVSPSYHNATWPRLLPFFRLPGSILWGIDRVEVELQPFNDRRLTRDLAAVCAQENAAQPRLPDGRTLHVRVKRVTPGIALVSQAGVAGDGG